jgi:hypothetical protein
MPFRRIESLAKYGSKSLIRLRIKNRNNLGPIPKSTNCKLRSLRLLIVLLILPLLLACSHKQPFVRSDISQFVDSFDESDITHRILLIGDAGKAMPNHAPSDARMADPTLRNLYLRAAEMPQKTTILFLGDNAYEKGLVDTTDKHGHKAAIDFLDSQLMVAKESGARGIFIPGNHDWNKGRAGGRAAIKRQEEYIAASWADHAALLPKSGCPGPFRIDYDNVRIVLLDTQWWFHRADDKPIAECFPVLKGAASVNTAGLIKTAKKAFLDSLRMHVNDSGGREVIVAAHHPLATHGPHGGFFEWHDYILPFPLVVPFARKTLNLHGQDLGHSRYKEFIKGITDALSSGKKPLIYAAGHDHSLQVLDGGDAAKYLIISGAGSLPKITQVTDGDDTLFALSRTGFMEVSFMRDGRVLLQVFVTDANLEMGEIVFSLWLR